MNIFDLFGKLKEFDDGLLEDLSFEDHTLIVQDTQTKIDAYHEVLVRLQNESERFDKAATILKERSRRLDNQVIRIKSYLLTACKINDISEFPGHTCKLKMIARKAIVPTVEAGAVAHAEYPDLCKQYIEYNYKWDKEALEKAFKEGKQVAKEVSTEYVRFY